MNRFFFISIIISLFLHSLVFVDLLGVAPSSKLNLSKNLGITQIKVSLGVFKPLQEPKKVPKQDLLGRNSKEIHKKIKQKKLENHELNRSKSVKESGEESIIAEYLTLVHKEIAKFKFKNRMAKRLKLTGVVQLKFNISWPNVLLGLEIVKSSKSGFLDNSALKSIELIEEIPQMPEILKSQTLPVFVTINYE
jgi:protein TonB